MKIHPGSVQVFSVAFQAVYIEDQLNNDGYDIWASSGSAGDTILVYGCRTESLNFYNGNAGQKSDIRGLNQQSSLNNYWTASAVIPLNTYRTRATADGLVNLYKATTAGTSAGTEPTWPATGTVADGSVVWTQTPVNTIYSQNIYTWDPRLNTIAYSNAVYAKRVNQKKVNYIVGPRTYTPTSDDEIIEADATLGNIMINDPVFDLNWSGRQLTVFRTDETHANRVDVKIGGAPYKLVPKGTIASVHLSSGGASQWQSRISNYRGPVSYIDAMTYAQLPLYYEVPLGTEFIITDCLTAGFNDTAAAGGANRVCVRSTGAAWKVC